MCLAIPMSIIEIDSFNARCEAREIERTVSLFLLQHETVRPGDMVMVHVGYAIEKVTPAQAKSAWDLYDEMLAAQDSEPSGLVPLNKPEQEGPEQEGPKQERDDHA